MITREEALRLCEIVLAQAKAAGAEDASVSLNSSIESHARVADNRITTSGRAEDLDITTTVWVDRRRGSAAGNDGDGSALKRLADEAVQIARVSPVHREYVPTLGLLQYGEAAVSPRRLLTSISPPAPPRSKRRWGPAAPPR